jgi:hypothetical protein
MPEKTNRQKTKHAQSWGQIGCVLGWRHQPPLSPVRLLYTVAIQGGEAFLGGGGMAL